MLVLPLLVLLLLLLLLLLVLLLLGDGFEAMSSPEALGGLSPIPHKGFTPGSCRDQPDGPAGASLLLLLLVLVFGIEAAA
jgi:hypothetical protein